VLLYGSKFLEANEHVQETGFEQPKFVARLPIGAKLSQSSEQFDDNLIPWRIDAAKKSIRAPPDTGVKYLIYS
jgi:hypothetical protein